MKLKRIGEHKRTQEDFGILSELIIDWQTAAGSAIHKWTFRFRGHLRTWSTQLRKPECLKGLLKRSKAFGHLSIPNWNFQSYDDQMSFREMTLNQMSFDRLFLESRPCLNRNLWTKINAKRFRGLVWTLNLIFSHPS